jgi:hypothetical protein
MRPILRALVRTGLEKGAGFPRRLQGAESSTLDYIFRTKHFPGSARISSRISKLSSALVS